MSGHASVEDRQAIEIESLTAQVATLDQLLAAFQRTVSEQAQRLDARAREIDARNADLRRVLDHVTEGLGIVDVEGRLGGQHSRILEEWFGAPRPGQSLWSYLGAHQPEFGEKLRLGWEQLAEDVLPFELALDQMPQLLRTRGRTFGLRLTPLGRDAAGGFLMAVDDRTAETEQRQAEAARHDLAAALDQVIRDRSGFAEFLRESTALVNTVIEATAPSADVYRALHTLKGNASIMGFGGLAELCHVLESHISDTGDLPAAELRGGFADRWRSVDAMLSALVSATENRVEVERSDYDELLAAIEAGLPREDLAARARAILHEPAERRFARLAEQVRTFASRLGHGDVAVRIEGNGIRLESMRWRAFWSSFVHVLRNAVAHGLEPGAERIARHKPEIGTISLSTRLEAGELVIEAGDDGRGIEWDAIARAADERGLPHRSRAELEDAMFTSGVSTREVADEQSGRGVGLSAVRTETERLGGRVQVESATGLGTCFRFRFPESLAQHTAC